MEDRQNFFGLNIYVLRWSGLWVPDRNYGGYKKAVAYNSILVSYSILFFTLAEFLALKESSQNLDDLIKNLNMSLSFLLTCFKVATWFYHRKAIMYIMDTLSNDARLFEKIDDFDPPSIIRREKKTKDYLTICFLTLACLVPISASLASFGQIWNSISINGTAGLDSIKLPYYSWVPFEYRNSSYLFALAVVYQCLALLGCGTMTVGKFKFIQNIFCFVIILVLVKKYLSIFFFTWLDMTYMALVSFTSAHLKISQGAFRYIKKTCLKRLNLQDEVLGRKHQKLDEEMHREVGKCIRHLQSLFRLCRMLEGIYTYLILLQILISLAVLCTCLFLVSAIPLGSQLFGNELAYLLAIENQLAVYCFAGNKITAQSEGIPLAVYECEWFGSSESFKKCMLFTMMRMRKPIYLTIGKFSPLTLNTFVTIGRKSYSLLAVLKNRN